jgi:hypothetical protein
MPVLSLVVDHGWCLRHPGLHRRGSRTTSMSQANPAPSSRTVIVYELPANVCCSREEVDIASQLCTVRDVTRTARVALLSLTSVRRELGNEEREWLARSRRISSHSGEGCLQLLAGIDRPAMMIAAAGTRASETNEQARPSSSTENDRRSRSKRSTERDRTPQSQVKASSSWKVKTIQEGTSRNYKENPRSSEPRRQMLQQSG